MPRKTQPFKNAKRGCIVPRRARALDFGTSYENRPVPDDKVPKDDGGADYFVVTVADNFHYMDKDEWYNAGSFETAETAIAAAKKIVDDCLEYAPGSTAQGMYLQYTMFGDDPFIVGHRVDGKPARQDVKFSAWEYAKRRCEELVAEGLQKNQQPRS